MMAARAPRTGVSVNADEPAPVVQAISSSISGPLDTERKDGGRTDRAGLAGISR